MTGERDHAEIYWADDGWRSRVVAANGHILFDGSQGYENRGDCEEMIRTRFGPIPIEFLNGTP